MRWLELALVVSMISGCAPAGYRNIRNPLAGQPTFDQDNYQCRRENLHQEVAANGATATVADDGMVKACMQARGWHENP